MLRRLLPLACLAAIISPLAAAPIKPGEPFDYPSMAFYPKRWKEKELDLPMLPWTGKNVTFVTIQTELDPEVMGAFIGHLDAGWALYADVTGGKPRPLKLHQGQPTIVGLPANDLSCGYGCGYVGATGIEMIHFYDGHYPAAKKNSNSVPHAYFYEMGRNYFTFGDRHSCFTTGFAVFMRYVCIDTLKLDDGDKRTRQVIDQAIDLFEKNDMNFVAGFTSFGGHGEKGDRLKDENGKAISPSDQNVLYASLLLKLSKANGGNEWTKKYFNQIRTLPATKPNDQPSAMNQCVGMMLAASLASAKDLTPLFAENYKLPLDKEVRKSLSKIKWDDPKLTAGEILTKLPAEMPTS